MKRAKVSKEKDSDSSEPQPKRRKGQNLLLRYPMTNQPECEDTESLEQHRQAISKELEKAKPRDSVLLPLLRSTYGERRMFILNEASCVKGILERFPSMRRPSVVCVVIPFCSLLSTLHCFSLFQIEQDMSLIFGKTNIKTQFLTEWNRYVPAILTYAEKSGKKGIAKHVKDRNECGKYMY